MKDEEKARFTPEQRAMLHCVEPPSIGMPKDDHALALESVNRCLATVKAMRAMRWDDEYPPGNGERESHVPAWVRNGSR